MHFLPGWGEKGGGQKEGRGIKGEGRERGKQGRGGGRDLGRSNVGESMCTLSTDTSEP